MNVLIGTNVVLDVLLKRTPWFADAAQIWARCESGTRIGALPASAFTDVFYVTRRTFSRADAFVGIDRCLRVFNVLLVDRTILERARHLPGNDFEDNVQIACALIAGLDAIVTRDPKGFAESPVLVLTPADLLARL